MTLQHERKFEMPSTAKSGINKNNKPYTNWKHKIGGRIFSSFKSAEELGLKDQENYIVAYEEAPNNTYPDKPYKNIINITPAVSKEELEESNKQYHVEPMGEPKAEDTDWEEINRIKQLNIDTSTVFNQTCNYIHHTPDAKYDNFNQFYERLWKLLQEKRKEKVV